MQTTIRVLSMLGLGYLAVFGVLYLYLLISSVLSAGCSSNCPTGGYLHGFVLVGCFGVTCVTPVLALVSGMLSSTYAFERHDPVWGVIFVALLVLSLTGPGASVVAGFTEAAWIDTGPPPDANVGALDALVLAGPFTLIVLWIPELIYSLRPASQPAIAHMAAPTPPTPEAE